MRVTDHGMLEGALQKVQRGNERLERTQHRAASGLIVERPSDDPVAFASIDDKTDQLGRLEGYGRNITLVRSRLQATEGALNSAQGLLTRFRELTMMSLNEVTVTPSVAVEAQQVYDGLVSLTNTSYGGDYVFGGFSGAAPFSGARFVGDNSRRAVQVSPLGATVFGVSASDAFGVLPGQDVFQGLADALAGMKAGNRAQIQGGLAAVDDQMSHISQALASLGAQQGTLRTAEEANSSYKLVLNQAIAEQRDADPAKIYSQLAADQYTQQATYAVLGAQRKLSILNYL